MPKLERESSELDEDTEVIGVEWKGVKETLLAESILEGEVLVLGSGCFEWLENGKRAEKQQQNMFNNTGRPVPTYRRRLSKRAGSFNP
jgi:hypothetical protein